MFLRVAEVGTEEEHVKARSGFISCEHPLKNDFQYYCFCQTRALIYWHLLETRSCFGFQKRLLSTKRACNADWDTTTSTHNSMRTRRNDLDVLFKDMYIHLLRYNNEREDSIELLWSSWHLQIWMVADVLAATQLISTLATISLGAPGETTCNLFFRFTMPICDRCRLRQDNHQLFVEFLTIADLDRGRHTCSDTADSILFPLGTKTPCAPDGSICK